MIKHNLQFIFTDGHAVDGLSLPYDQSHIAAIENIIDIDAIKAKYWKDDKDLDLKRKKEAEFLVEDDVPIAAILGYAVYNQASKEKLIELGVEEKKIIVRQEYYF